MDKRDTDGTPEDHGGRNGARRLDGWTQSDSIDVVGAHYEHGDITRRVFPDSGGFGPSTRAERLRIERLPSYCDRGDYVHLQDPGVEVRWKSSSGARSLLRRRTKR